MVTTAGGVLVDDHASHDLAVVVAVALPRADCNDHSYEEDDQRVVPPQVKPRFDGDFAGSADVDVAVVVVCDVKEHVDSHHDTCDDAYPRHRKDGEQHLAVRQANVILGRHGDPFE